MEEALNLTLDAIKNEITARLREVRAESSDFNATENYRDLQKLITKAIGKVELCENADELESIDGILSAIEELYNACMAEETGEISDETLFEFAFELDDSDEDNEEDLEDEDSEEEDGKQKKSVKAKEKKIEKKQTKSDLYCAAKESFDEKYPTSVMKKPNIARLCVGLVALISGTLSGLITAQWWPFDWWAWSIIGVGVSYLILAAVYSIVIAVGNGSATRRMSFTRLILAVVAAIASLILGIVFEFELTLVGAYIATLPFTVFGLFTYLIYRTRLFFIACKTKKRNKVKNKAKNI